VPGDFPLRISPYIYPEYNSSTQHTGPGLKRRLRPPAPPTTALVRGACKKAPPSSIAVGFLAAHAMSKRPAHPQAGQHLLATGAPDGGYRIPESGIINARDRSGTLVRPPFNVPKSKSLVDVTTLLEDHIDKHSRAGTAFHLLAANRCDLIHRRCDR